MTKLSPAGSAGRFSLFKTVRESIVLCESKHYQKKAIITNTNSFLKLANEEQL